MSIKRWSYSIVPAALLLAATASADPAAAPAKSPGPAPAASPQADNPQARRTLGAQAAAEGKQGRKADSQAPAASARAGEASGHSERGHDVAAAAPGHEDHEHGQGRADAPPRAAIEALMKAQSLTEEQAIAHLRGPRGQATAAGEADARRARHNEVRRERAKELRGRLKSRGIPNQLRVELRTHAKRIAQIERIRTLAAADAKLITRIDAALLQENERHTRRMTRLVDEANQAPTGGTTPAEAAPAAAPVEAPTAAPVEAPTAAPTAADKPAAAPALEAQKPAEQGVTP